MKRSWLVAASAALVIAIGTVGAAAPAAAAPPTAPWSGSAGGSVASVTADAVGLTLADLGVAISSAEADSTATPRAVSSSSNISAAAVGLPISVSTNSVFAPPDAPPENGGIAATVTGLVDVGAITTTNEAHWGLDTACVTDGVLSAATTQTAGLGVLPAVSGGVVSLGVSQTTGETGLVQNAGLNHGVESVASGTITGLSILGGLVDVAVAGETTLTATATGTSTGTVTYLPATVTVDSAAGTVVLTPAAPSTTVNLLGLGTVTVSLNTPTQTTTATSASASVALLTVDVRLPAAPLPAVTDVSVDVLPLTAAATAPSGGIDCPPAPPVITSPAEGATTSATPTISGTSEPDALVEVFIDGATVGTTTADGAGVWSLPLATALSEGAHSATAIQTVGGTASAPSTAVGFIVDATPPPPPVIALPLDGAVLNTATPAISGTAEANSTVNVVIDGSPAGTAPADGTGAWTFTPATPLADGAHSVVATSTDAAGNTSGPSNAVDFTIDATAPLPPVITSPTTGSVLATTTPPISGTAEANATVTVIIDGALAGMTTAGGTGAWTFTPPAPLTQGAHTAVATAADALGNVSAESNTVTFTIDTVAPLAPVITSPADGAVVATTTPPIAGTAEANSTVAVVIDDVPAGTTTADGTGAWSFTPSTPLSEGPHTVVATATDAAGNVSPESNEVDFTVDLTDPPAPVITDPTTGDVLDTATPAIVGTAEANATVTVIIDGSPAGTTTANGTGAWTFTPPTPLSEGEHTVVATAEDAAGNVSPESNEVTFTVDTVAPAPPTITEPTTGDLLDTATPDIVGTAEANSTVTVTIDGTVAGTTTASDTGAWTFTPTTPLSEGDHTVVATAEDAAGNVSPESNEVTFTIDTVAPPAPVVTSPADGAVVDTATPPITGTAEANSTVTVIIDGDVAGTTTADGTGAWTFTPPTPLAEGEHTVVATAEDAAGNVSPESDEVTFTVDTVLPAAPVIVSPATGTVVDTATPPITGTAEANSTVTVTIDGTVAGTTTASDTGAWTFTPTTPLAEGAHSAVATAEDAAGNVSPESNTVTFSIDTVVPVAPVIIGPVNGAVLATATPPITGTAEANSTVTVIIDGDVAGTTTADGTGAWTFTPPAPLADGEHAVVATAEDAAGNVGPVSNEVTFTVDTAAPAAPVIVSPLNGAVLGTTTPPITGTAEANSTVTVIIDGVPAGTTTADGGGIWSFIPPTPLAEGPHTAVATATDAAGNVSAESNEVDFTVDTAAPAAPVIVSPTTGAVLTDSTPTISGTAEANSTVTVIIDGVPAGTTAASGTGAWTFTPSGPLADGAHTVVATATDAAGNESPESNEVGFTIDATPPAAPQIVAPADGAVLGTPTPVITGTAEPNSTVTIIIDGAPAGTATADGTGAWTFTPPTPLADGEHTVTATATDAAGNMSPPSAEVAFTIDTTPPAAPVITSPADGSTTTDPTPTVTGTAEPGSTVNVIIDGVLAGSTTADGDGGWSFTPTTPLTPGAHTITATATDQAGNVGPASAPVTVTVNALATPPQPTPPATAPGAGAGSGSGAGAGGGLAATGGAGPLGALLLGSLLVALGVAAVGVRRRTS